MKFKTGDTLLFTDSNYPEWKGVKCLVKHHYAGNVYNMELLTNAPGGRSKGMIVQLSLDCFSMDEPVTIFSKIKQMETRHKKYLEKKYA